MEKSYYERANTPELDDILLRHIERQGNRASGAELRGLASDLGLKTAATIHRSLQRLIAAGKVKRVSRGTYVTPAWRPDAPIPAAVYQTARDRILRYLTPYGVKSLQAKSIARYYCIQPQVADAVLAQLVAEGVVVEIRAPRGRLSFFGLSDYGVYLQRILS